MAKVIRSCWVWRKNNRWWRYLPRRVDGYNKLNMEDEYAFESLRTFPEPMQCKPPKLWVVWIFRDFNLQNVVVKDHIKKLFGDDAKPGEIHVFKNTPSSNIQLWKIKHIIEVRPMIFPQGEPTLEDAHHLEIMADGRCLVSKEFPNPEGIQLIDSNKQFSCSYLVSLLRARDLSGKDVFEDTVYNPANISIVD